MKSPVVFLVFKRPAPTARVLAAIREAKPPVLFVVADGPRPENATEAASCAEVRALVEAGVDWPCELVRIYSETNLGCARRVSSGLDAVFERVEAAIILEDDCLPAPAFFPFCDELLERYRDDGRVAQITGSNFIQDADGREGASYRFSRYPHCWGWATWRRAWRHYEHDLGKRARSGLDFIGRRFVDRDERRYWRWIFRRLLGGEFDSWAYRWHWTVFCRCEQGIVPSVNLITNIGFGEGATHTRETTHAIAELPRGELRFPLQHPHAVKEDEHADDRVRRLLYTRRPFFARLLRRVGRELKRAVVNRRRAGL